MVRASVRTSCGRCWPGKMTQHDVDSVPSLSSETGCLVATQKSAVGMNIAAYRA
jgi:hypothetical protein